MRSTASRWPLAVRNRLTTDRRCCSFMASSSPAWGGVRRVARQGIRGGDGGAGPKRTPGSQSGAAARPAIGRLGDFGKSPITCIYAAPVWLRGCTRRGPIEVPGPPSESSDRMGLHRRGRALGILLLLVGADIVPSVLVALIAPVSPLALVASRASAISAVPPSPSPHPSPSPSPSTSPSPT